MLERQAPPSWVTKRAECNLDLIFEALSQIVTRDVGEMNALPESKRNGYTYKVETNSDGVFPIIRVGKVSSAGEEVRAVFFQLKRDFIHTNASGNVHVRWDQEANACQLLINENRYEVWQVSQWVLGPLFFGSDDL